ncbi:hypothetical protein N5D48_19525 [Pseudomonas sp. GD03858]|uniref:hypothetical protein n=1 Tax=unclassified Pseudomonas TaxID=196821 RepID=UPI00244BED97|nr:MULTISPECIES: hypothetical protein [unclassified Pseudomonas]MDH0648591.1 hypothetical protein [Pseudomonas sp. GD03867]MDH0664597.1 hypothetical protein [Pseudomonas sp. GD03858]
MPLLPDQMTQENWLPLLASDDIDALMKHFGGFADSIVITYECWGETHIDEEACIVYPPDGPQADQNMRITFQRQTLENFSVQLLLRGVTEFKMRGRNENFDGIINAMSIEGDTQKSYNLVAKSFLDGPEILAARMTTLYWRPMPVQDT